MSKQILQQDTNLRSFKMHGCIQMFFGIVLTQNLFLNLNIYLLIGDRMLCHKNHFWLPDDHAELDFTGEVFTFSQI